MNIELIQESLNFLAIVFGIILFVIGWLSQARTNYRRKSTEGLSLPLYLISTVTVAVWLAYGMRKGIPMLIVPNLFGLIIGLFILIQFAWYSRKTKEKRLFSSLVPLLFFLGLTEMLGLAGVGLNFVMSIIGFLHQIWKNYKKPSGIEGLETKTYLLWFSATLINFLYGMSIKDLPLIIGGIPGLVFLGILLLQIQRFQKQKRAHSSELRRQA